MIRILSVVLGFSVHVTTAHEGLDHLKKKFKQHNISATLDLAQSYLDGRFGIVNKPLANFYFLKAMDFGSSKAMKAVADGFYSGDGFPQSESIALYYYWKSARKDYCPGAYNIVVIHKHRCENPLNADQQRLLKKSIVFFEKKCKKHWLSADVARIKSLRAFF